VTHDGHREAGSAPAEFVLVSVLLLALVLGVLQLGAVLFVRNTAQDAAAEGARWAALDGNGPAAGAARTRQVLGTALGPVYTRAVSAGIGAWNGQRVATVTVTTPLPVIGLIGVPGGLTLVGHAAIEE
jgi:Flp pilus assembly protein TadG